MLLCVLLQACGGGSSGPSGPAEVVVSGVVTFDRVPVVPGSGPGAGLDHDATAVTPARRVTVEFDDGAAVLASASTDDTGAYSLAVPRDRVGRLRVRAEAISTGSPSWDVRVVDNTEGNALYVLEGTSFSTGSADSVRDLHAGSGWTGAGYGGARAAAPFAILDTIRAGIDLVAGADAGVSLPPLVVHWSPDNIPSRPEDGVDTAAGEIISTFYSSALGGIFVLGAENSDTDEFDRHVILHEWAHYLEHALARSDTIGGPHAFGDHLDMRVAFSEGFANAFAAIAAGDNIYSDVLGPGQSVAPAFDVEGLTPSFNNSAPGWFSEQSIHEIVYDFFDDAVDGPDSMAVGFDVLYDVFVGPYRDAVSLTSLFSFAHFLKEQNASEAPLIDMIVGAQSIDAIVDNYGTGETNGTSNPADVLPIYVPLQVDGAAVNVCSTDEFESTITSLVNKLGTRRFLRFEVAGDGPVTIEATATLIPTGESADPDLVLHRAGPLEVAESSPSAACLDVSSPGWQPENCSETLSTTLSAGEHVLELYEYTNTLDRSSSTPPIGRACFDVTVVSS